MTALVNTDTGEIIEPMPSAEARQLTTEAQTEFGATADHYERGWAAIPEVLRRNGFLALGYRSQGDYLGTDRPTTPTPTPTTPDLTRPTGTKSRRRIRRAANRHPPPRPHSPRFSGATI